MSKREDFRDHILFELTNRTLTLHEAVDGYLLSLELENRSPRTLENARGQLSRFLWFCEQQGYPSRLTDLNHGHVKSFLAYLSNPDRWDSRAISSSRPAKASTVAKYRLQLHALWEWAIREELVDANPVDRTRAPRVERRLIPSLSEAEIRALVDVCRKGVSHNPRRDLAIVLLMLDTGMRVSEVCALKLSSWQRDRIVVLGKGRKERALSLSPATAKAIWDYLQKERPDSFYQELFLTDGGTPLDRSAVTLILRRRSAEAGIRRVNPHLLRHTFSLQWCKAGGPLHALQSQLGHESPAMSLRYGQQSADDVSELHRQYSPVDRLNLRLRDRKRP